MKKSIWSALAIFLVFTLALVGCGSGSKKDANSSQPAANSSEPAATQSASPSQTAAKGKIKIGYDIYFLGNSWSVQMYKEFQSEVKRHQDEIGDVIYVDSEGKVDKQIANLEDLIVKGVDVIITTPNSPTALVPVLKKAQDKGIKVVLLAAKINASFYDSLVTVDDYDFGKTGAEWLAKQLNGKGKIIALNGIAGLSTNEERWKGAKDVFDKYPDIKVVASVNADWDYAKAKLEVGNLLAANSEIDGVWSQGGAMTLGAIESFQAANRKLVPMTGEDNNGFLKKWKELKSSGFTSIAASKPTWLGSEALKTALDLYNGKAVKKDMILPVPQITDENLDKLVRPDLPDSYWANSRMTDEEIKATFSK
jgi:ribose transport system substrate-binding protein